jgi:hypothetical protein
MLEKAKEMTRWPLMRRDIGECACCRGRWGVRVAESHFKGHMKPRLRIKNVPATADRCIHDLTVITGSYESPILEHGIPASADRSSWPSSSVIAGS